VTKDIMKKGKKISHESAIFSLHKNLKKKNYKFQRDYFFCKN